MFPLLIPLLGAGAGALLSKKDPLKGALMGGALGFGGAALAPGLLGAGAAAGTAATGAGTAAGTAATGAAAPAWSSLIAAGQPTIGTVGGGMSTAAGAANAAPAATPGLFESAFSYAKQADPIMKAAVMGKTLAGTGQQQPQASPLMPNNGQGGNTLSALMQQGNQYQTALQQAQMARMQRRSQW